MSLLTLQTLSTIAVIVHLLLQKYRLLREITIQYIPSKYKIKDLIKITIQYIVLKYTVNKT